MMTVGFSFFFVIAPPPPRKARVADTRGCHCISFVAFFCDHAKASERNYYVVASLHSPSRTFPCEREIDFSTFFRQELLPPANLNTVVVDTTCRTTTQHNGKINQQESKTATSSLLPHPNRTKSWLCFFDLPVDGDNSFFPIPLYYINHQSVVCELGW